MLLEDKAIDRADGTPYRNTTVTKAKELSISHLYMGFAV